MTFSIKSILQTAIGKCAIAAVAFSGVFVTPAMAQQTHIPGIWIDPDGCEHFVMDDGMTGYMSPHLQRNGSPVCHRGNVCGMMWADELFQGNQTAVLPAGRLALIRFFQETPVRGFMIHVHDDNRGGERSSLNRTISRAQAIARISAEVGVPVVDARGFGGQLPRVSNNTVAGMAENRRVEIICVQ